MTGYAEEIRQLKKISFCCEPYEIEVDFMNDLIDTGRLSILFSL